MCFFKILGGVYSKGEGIIYLPIYLFSHLPFYLSIYLPICLSTSLPIYLFTVLSIYLFIHPSMHPSIYPVTQRHRSCFPAFRALCPIRAQPFGVHLIRVLGARSSMYSAAPSKCPGIEICKAIQGETPQSPTSDRSSIRKEARTLAYALTRTPNGRCTRQENKHPKSRLPNGMNEAAS